MKTLFLFASLAITSTALFAADNAATEKVTKASKQLAEKPNYSWTATTKEADGSPDRLGPIEGKSEKNGVTFLSLVPGGIPVEVYMKGDKGVARALEGWQTFDEIAQSGGAAAMIARFLRSYKTPAAQATELARNASELKDSDGILSGDLKGDTIQEMLLMGTRRREGQEAPKTTDTKGSVKFWIKDGVLTKYELNVQGKVALGERSLDINRTTAVEISEVGSTKIEVPEEAKQKI